MLLVAGCGGQKRQIASQQHTQLGSAKLQEGDAEGAVADLTIARRNRPDDPEITHLLGMAYWAKGRLLKDEGLKLQAERWILDSFRLKGDDVPGDWHNNLGALYVELKRFPEAVVELEKALHDPGYRTPERPLNNLSKSALEQRKFTEAIAYAERALRVQPRFCMALVNKGTAEREVKRYEDALQSMLRAIRECPEWPEPYLVAGLVYWETKKPSDARDFWLKAKARDPDGPIGKDADRYLRSLGR